jgi:hypothetical protein
MRPVLALALALVAACQPRAVSAPAAGDGAGDASGAAPGATPLAVSFQIQAGDSVAFVLQATNTTAAPLAVQFPSGQSYDFSVEDAGRTVWRWSDGMMFTQMVRNETLAPGETRTYREVWHPDASLRGRSLAATARLTSTNHASVRTQTFRLP